MSAVMGSILFLAAVLFLVRVETHLKRIQRELTSLRLLGERVATDRGVLLDSYDEAFAEVWGMLSPSSALARKAMRERAHRLR